MAPLIGIALQLAAKFAPDALRHFGADETATSVAEKVVEIAQAVSGTDTPTAALDVLSKLPEHAAEFRMALLDADSELERLATADRADARKLQGIALQQDDLFSKRFVYYFAAAWSLFTMFYITAITFWPPGESGQAIANTVLGFLLGTAVASIFAYFYGSTKGSAEKTRLLATKG